MKRREFLKYFILIVLSLLGISFYEKQKIDEKERELNYILNSIKIINKHLENIEVIKKENINLEKEFLKEQGEVQLYELDVKRFAYINNKNFSQKLRFFSFLVDLGRLCEKFSINNVDKLSIITESNDFICREVTRNLNLLAENQKLDYGISVWIPRIMVSKPDNLRKILKSKKLSFVDFCALTLRKLYNRFKGKNYVTNLGLIVQQSDSFVGAIAFIESHKRFFKLYDRLPPFKNFDWKLIFGYSNKNKRFVIVKPQTNFEPYKGYPLSLEIMRYFNLGYNILEQLKLVDLKMDIDRNEYIDIYSAVITKYLEEYNNFLKTLVNEIIQLSKEKIKKQSSGTIFVFS